MWKIVISVIPMFVCLFWCIVLFIEHRTQNKAKTFLSFFMFIAFLLYLGHAAYFNKEYKFYGFWDSIYLFCSLAVYPLYFIYLKIITKKTNLNFKDFLVLLPAFSIGVFSFILYFMMTPEELTVYTQQIIYHNFNNIEWTPILHLQQIKLYLFTIIFVAQIIPILIYGSKYIKEYNQAIMNYYADTEKKTLDHFNFLLIVFILTSLASSTVDLIGRSYFTQSNIHLLIPAIIFGFLLFMVGYLGYKQDFSIENFLKDIKNNEALASTIKISINDTELYGKNLFENLKKLLEENEIYKNKDLCITDIAMMLNTNRTYISKIMNEKFKTNFSTMINHYRIEHAKKILKDSKYRQLNINEIGELSGFSSESSFYRIFKNHENISPGNYRKKHLINH